MVPQVVMWIRGREREGNMGEAISRASAQGGVQGKQTHTLPACLRVCAPRGGVISTRATIPLAAHTTCLRVDAQLEQQGSRHHAATQTKKPAYVRYLRGEESAEQCSA